MRRFHSWKFILVATLGLFTFTAAELPNVAAQDDATKAAGKASEEDPFGKEVVKKEEGGRERPPAGHQIVLQEPAVPGQSLEERLMGKATLQATEAPLHQLVESLGAALDAPVVLSVKKLEEAAINLETPLTYRLKNVKLQAGLRFVLDEIGLTYLVVDDAIVITTPEDAGSRLITRVYDCRELMKLPSPVKKVARPRAPTQGNGIGTSEIPAAEPEKGKEVGPDGGYDITDLVRLIQTTVAPDTWDEVGGPGSMADFKGLVTVSQTQDVHDQVEKLLNMLHKAGALEEKVKVSR
jgi:general secretion pathway protein D